MCIEGSSLPFHGFTIALFFASPNNIPLYGCAIVRLRIAQIRWHIGYIKLGIFQVWAVVKNVDERLCAGVCVDVGFQFNWVNKCRGAWFLDHMMRLRLAWKNLPVFQSYCTILHSPMQWARVSVALHPCQVVSVFLNFSIMCHGISLFQFAVTSWPMTLTTFSCAYLLPVRLLWWSSYSHLLHIFLFLFFGILKKFI